MSDIQRETFELRHETETWRVIRGVVESPPGGSDQAVLCLHGFKGFMGWGFFPELRRRLVDAGFTAVAFDTSVNGIGPDGEHFTEEEAFTHNTWTRELEDVARVREHVDPLAERWSILGHSRGGGSALLHAAERGDYEAIVTWAAVSHVKRYGEETLASWRELGHLPIVNARTGQTLKLGIEVLEDVERNADRLDILSACRRIQAPTLLLHGSEDDAVPVTESEQLAEAFPEGVARRQVIGGAGHTFGAVHPYEGTPPSLEVVFDATLEHLQGAR